MTIRFDWVEQRILLATYSGTLSAEESRHAVSQRAALLEQMPHQIIFVADARHIESVEAHEVLLRHTSLIGHERISHAFVAISASLFRTVRRAIEDTPDSAIKVSLVTDLDFALAQARAWATHLD